MGLIRDKIAGNARESVQNSVYQSDRASGFDSLPSTPVTHDRSANVRSAEQYEKGNVPGVNVYTCQKPR